MVLSVMRQASAKGCTLSTWYVNGQLACYGIEDIVRPAGQYVFGKTAIPAGTYEIEVTYSTRFQRRLPLVQDVRGHQTLFGPRPLSSCGIRIHPGNWSTDTEGCLLPGTAISADRTQVLNSRAAFESLFGRIEQAEAAGEPITLIIR